MYIIYTYYMILISKSNGVLNNWVTFLIFYFVTFNGTNIVHNNVLKSP